MQVGIDVTCMHTNFGGCCQFTKQERPCPQTWRATHLMNLYLHEFSERILFIVHGGKGIFGRFEGKQKTSKISKTKKATPTKIGVHAFHTNPYLHEFFELILSDSIFSLPWAIVHGLKGKFGQI